MSYEAGLGSGWEVLANSEVSIQKRVPDKKSTSMVMIIFMIAQQMQHTAFTYVFLEGW